MRNPTAAIALDTALRAPTPLLRVGNGLAKLELLRPTGGAEDRALAAWDEVAPHRESRCVAVGSMGAALAGAAWARARGVDLHQIVHGPLTHEGRKVLEIWGFAFEHAASAAEALRRAAQQSASATLLPPLDGSVAAAAFAASIGPELGELQAEPAALIAPAGARAALLGTLAALRERWPGVRAIALVAASRADELPELPADVDLDGVVLRAVTRAEAAAARAWVTRTAGLLAGHAAARAVQLAHELSGLALVTSTGEREFSLDPRAAQ